MFHASICEYQSPSFSPQDSDLERYNRSTGIEIRGIFPVPNESKENLGQYEGGKLYDTIPVYTEDVKLIRRLGEISMREETPNPSDDPVQMIVFCPMAYLNKLLTNSKWITNTLDISTRSCYVMPMGRDVRHALFCKTTCYHVEQDKKKSQRERQYIIWHQQQQAMAWEAAQRANEAEAKEADGAKISLGGECRDDHTPNTQRLQINSTKEFPTLRPTVALAQIN